MQFDWLIGASLIMALTLGAVVQAAQIPPDSIPRAPSPIPDGWLSPDQSPRVFCTPKRLKAIRDALQETPWRVSYVERRKRAVAPLMKLSDEQLRAIVPPPKSLFIYGLGMNLDPVHHQRMIWGDWANPHEMKDVKGKVYPNKQWNDTGRGVKDPKTGKTYYFVAMANGEIVKTLEAATLPALADLWTLTGEKKYAHVAAVLLDAVAAVYPTNRRGPMDYPTAKGDEDRGGRLNRPYYQTARGLMNYAFAIDLLADSGEFNQPSAYGKGQTIRDNIIRNLLWDGGSYCLDFALRGHALHNGQADYEQGAAVVGALLGVRAFAQPMIDGPADFEHMLANNVGPDGFYVESSTMYANWTRQLYVHSAELLTAMRRMGWKDVPDPYANPAMVRFLGPEFDRLELSGHVPMIGDAGPDRAVVDPMRRFPWVPRVYNDVYLDGQITGAWLRLIHGVETASAAQLLRDTYGGKAVIPPASPWYERWYIYNLTPAAVSTVEKRPLKPDAFETGSTFYGAKGLALLRGGQGVNRHGAQLFFGALHNHGQHEALTWTFFARGAAWSLDPGYFNTHFRFGWTEQSVGHQAMVVNQTSVPQNDGTGELLSWHQEPSVQWAMASQPSAYADQGVHEYQRLIAQVQRENGKLAYWLDIGRVAGGKVRDDSFHCRMTQASFDIQLPPADPSRPALYGDKNLGDLIQADMRLKGFEKKPFYWAPPGDGYGFLGNPRQAAMPSTVRGIFTKPAVRKREMSIKDCRMIVDFSGGTNRQFILADGPGHTILPAVPYVLRRDQGKGSSTFAKVIRLVDSEKADPIASFEPLQVQSKAANDESHVAPSAWCVTWKNGRRDVWIVADPQQDGAVHVSGRGIPPITTNGRVTWVQLDRSGRVLHAVADQAKEVTVEAGPSLNGAGALRGTITAIDPSASPARFEVRWESKPSKKALAGAMLHVDSANSQSSTWRIASIDSDGVTLDQVKPWMGMSHLEPVADAPGWYHLQTPISQFDSPGGQRNTAYAKGRTVYEGDRPVARVAGLSDDGQQIQLTPLGASLPQGAFDARVLLAAPGDQVIVPLQLTAESRPATEQGQ